MKLTGDTLGYNFDNVQVDSFWNEGNEDEHKMHRIHTYPAKFPAFITTKAINYSKDNGLKIKTIGDIFCGCGTTSYEARRNGIDFWGCDINPVATLIAEVKSKKYCEETLNSYFEQIIINFDSIKTSDEEIENINERIKFWFCNEQIRDLLRLKKSIYYTIPVRSHYRKFFLCAFSNILKKTSNWLLKSIKPQRDPNKIHYGVKKSFQDQFKLMQIANRESDLSRGTRVKIETVNFLERKFRRPFVDLLITSPPYVTSYEYADLHQLSTLWLDYSEDFKSLRKGTIGSEFNFSDFKNDVKYLNNIGERIVFQLYNFDKSKAKAVARYYIDIQNCICKSYNILNKGGMALFVIGNTELRGVKIDNARHLVESMITVGFSDIDIVRRNISNKFLTPYRDDIGRFTTDRNSRIVYAEEFIVMGRKYGKCL